MRLGEIALSGMSEVRQRFLTQAERFENAPVAVRCMQNILQHQQNLGARADAGDFSRLSEPYRTYCAIGDVFRKIDSKSRLDDANVYALERAPSLQNGDSFRLEAVIEAELYQQSAGIALLIGELHQILSGTEDAAALQYFHKLQ